MSSEEPFVLIEPLGTGGFAHTYRAKVIDEDLREDFGAEEVALKIPLNRKKERALRHELELNASLYRRIKNLERSNLVRYLGFAVFRGQIVMAMEYIPQGSLRKLLGSHAHPKRLPVEEAVRIAIGVLRGLTVIHEERVFHRDIKPENILMDGNTPKIADLGISRILASNELASTTTGTIYYMSPESLGEEGCSFSSDLWSLGVMLYEMLTARLPLGSFTTPIGTIVDLIRQGNYQPVCELCDDIPKELSTIIDRVLRMDPKARLTASEMQEALLNFQQGTVDEVEQELRAIEQTIASGTQEDLNQAEIKLQNFIAEHKRCSKAYQCLGELYNLCQRFQDAISVFQKGLKFLPDSDLLHWDLALAYQKTGQRSKATQHLRKVIDLAQDASLSRHARTLLMALQRGA